MPVPKSNRLLDALSRESCEALLATSDHMDLPIRTSLQKQEEVPRYAYFMTSGVALVAGTLQRGGFIEYSRGKVTIQSREELQTVACDCYAVTLRLLDGLYPEG